MFGTRHSPARWTVPVLVVLCASGVAAGSFLASPGITTMMLATGSDENLQKSPTKGIRYCLNTSTIRGQDVGIEQEIDIAAQAGYDGIEPWMPMRSNTARLGIAARVSW